MDFTSLSKQEAEAYRAQFVDETPSALEWLSSEWAASGRDIAELDFSPASLTPLWEWARTRVRPRAEGEPLTAAPSWTGETKLHRRLSNDTLRVLDATARYFAEVILRNVPGTTWSVGSAKTKGYVDQNWPVVSGLADVVNPVRLVLVAASSGLDGVPVSPNRLRELYDMRVGTPT